MTTTWTIAIDWDRNGNYTDTYDDVTSRVISANWKLGMRLPYTDMADESTLDLVLDNTDKRYSSEHASSPLTGKVVPQRPVRIQSNDGTTTRTHWIGWIEAIQPAVNRYGKRTVQIVAVGAMQFLKAAETDLPTQKNKRTDEVIGELIKEVVLPPALNHAWVMSRPGSSELSASTYLITPGAYSQLDTGTLTLGVAADNWTRQGGFADANQNKFDVYRAIGDITAAEHGRFFFNREGKAVFWNRHKLLLGTAAVDETFNDSMTGLEYSYAGLDYLKNEVIVVSHPRSISASTNDLLWSLDAGSVITVSQGIPRKITISYDEEDGKRVSAEEVSVANVTFQSGSATVTVKALANGVELTFTAIGNGPSDGDAVVSGVEVRGRKIVDGGEVEAKAIDSTSLIDYGRRTMRLNLPSIDNVEQAQSIADHERTKRSKPRGMVQALTVTSHGKNGGGQHAQQLALTIGNLIQVIETQTAHDSKYHIIGEAHELTMGATLWKTTWYLEPTPTVYNSPTKYPWLLGVSNRSNVNYSTTLVY